MLIQRTDDIRTERHGANSEYTLEQVLDMFRRLIFLGRAERDPQNKLTDFAEYVEDVIAVATLKAKGDNVRAWQSLEDLLRYAMKASDLGTVRSLGGAYEHLIFHFKRPVLEDCEVIINPTADGRNQKAFISWNSMATFTIVYIVTGEYPPDMWTV
jgi:hypothetical protein